MSYPTYSTNNGVGCESATGDVKIGVGSGGLTVEYDILTTPKTFHISPLGVEWTDGSATYTTGLGRLSAVQEALQAVELPPNSTTLEINNSLLATNGGTNSITINASVPNIVITDGTNTNTITATGGGGGGSQNIEQVLTTGDNANGLSITGLNNVNLNTINGSSYPPSVSTPNLSAVLGSGNDATGYDINNVNNINVSTINYLTPTTIGLTWSSFTAQNAYNNLPSSYYALDDSAGNYSYQTATYFQVSNNSSQNTTMTPTSQVNTVATNEWYRYDYNGGSPFVKVGYDSGAGGGSNSVVGNGFLTTNDYSYSTSNRWEGRFAMEADGGLHIKSWNTSASTLQPLLLECSNLYVNGTPIYQPVSYFSNSLTSSYFSISAGTMQQVSTLGYLTINAGTYRLEFSMFCDTVENTGQLFLEFYNVYYGSVYTVVLGNNSRYVNGNAINGIQNSTTFNFNDTITFTNTDSYEVRIICGHNGGSWSTNITASVGLYK